MLFHKKKRRKKKKKEVEKISLTTSVKVVWFILLNACGWIWCSYLLAYLGRISIAEDLSKVALTAIVAVVLSYFGKALTENISKNNTWPDKPASVSTSTAENYESQEVNSDVHSFDDLYNLFTSDSAVDCTSNDFR